MAQPPIPPSPDYLARAQASYGSFYNRLYALRTAAQKSNPRINPLASGYTLTMSATAPATGSNPATTRSPSDNSSAAAFVPYVTLAGGWTFFSGNFIYSPAATKDPTQLTTGGSSSVAYMSAQRAVFYSTAATLYVRLSTTQTANVRVIVDGQYIDKTGTAFTANNTINYLQIACGSRSPQGRRFEIELVAGENASVGVMQFGGVYQAQTEAVWATPDMGPRVIIFGDSYTFGVGPTINSDGWARVWGDLNGITDTWPSGVAGEGIIVRGSSGTTSAGRDRPFDITGNNPELAIIALGANDANQEGNTYNGITVSTATVQTEMTSFLRTVRAAKPYLPIIVLGPWQFASVTQHNRAASYEAAIQAAVIAVADPMIVFEATVGAPVPFQTGTGFAGSPTYVGINDWAIGTDATHNTTDGAYDLAVRSDQSTEHGMRQIAINIGLIR